MDLNLLKSGSDIRGTAFEDFSIDAATALALGFSEYTNAKTIFLGHDSRNSAPILSQAIIESLLSFSVNVNYVGLASTPSMFMTTILNGANGAIMLTASHHPKEKNGMKFFTKDGGVTKKQLDEIINLSKKYINLKPNNKNRLVASYNERDYLSDYCNYIRKYFIDNLGEDKPLKGLRIAVDAGNGSSGFFASRILQPLGADISSSQYLEPNGDFPFHKPNPEDENAIKSISKRVLETKSDLGIIFDADGDRSAIVDHKGNEINKNRLIALVSEILLEENKGAYIVTDSVASKGVTDFILDKGGIHIRYKRGYQNVISYAKKLNEEGKNAVLAIETSSHAALKQNYFLDDGAYLASFLIMHEVKLRRKNKTLSDLISTLKEPKYQKEIRIKTENNSQEYIDSLKQLGRLDENSYEGIRVYLEDGYFTARASVHDPVLVINIDCDDNLESIEKQILNVIK